MAKLGSIRVSGASCASLTMQNRAEMSYMCSLLLGEPIYIIKREDSSANLRHGADATDHEQQVNCKI